VDFEFDPSKSRNNKEKHNIDFVEAQLLWEDPDRIEIPVRTEDEPRAIVIGTIKGKHWSAIITTRSEQTRIISVRRSRKKEIELYEG
jgi:uncharacterized DUF497 family protein